MKGRRVLQKLPHIWANIVKGDATPVPFYITNFSRLSKTFYSYFILNLYFLKLYLAKKMFSQKHK